MSVLSRYATWYGRDKPPAETTALRAGPLSAILDGIDLRYIRRGGVEVVRRLYVAVRDHQWDTIPSMISGLRREIGDDQFTITFEVTHHRHDVDFSWQGRIEGTPDGTIRYGMDGQANGAFRYNRIGFCLLHPPAESAGRPYRGQTPEGSIEGILPELIGPQRVENGRLVPLFPSVSSLEIDLAGEVGARFTFEGDLFEMEDQRNWTDASYKTYCTPLALPWPRDAHPGQRIAQVVTITTSGAENRTEAGGEDGIAIHLDEGAGRRLPPIGLGMASHGGALSAREVTVLRALQPSHLRADLSLFEKGYPEELERAIGACKALGCALELALFLGEDPATELDALAPRLHGRVRVARVLVFRRGEICTAGRWVSLARERIQDAVPGAPFVGGTNIYFTELNRERPEIADMDAVAYSINPQVHAFDEISLMETVAAQADTVRTARAFCDDRPLIVGPITLKPRFNPHAEGIEPAPGPGELPAAVDPRQMSLFGAAWTAGSAKYLAESGAASLTYYETTGWRGVMETEAGSPPDRPFASFPGMIFPLYHVLADLGEWEGGDLLACRSSDPLRVEALAVRTGGTVYLLVANLTATEQRITLSLPATARTAVRHLDERTAPLAAADPERFRETAELLEAPGGRFVLALAPYAVARLDARIS